MTALAVALCLVWSVLGAPPVSAAQKGAGEPSAYNIALLIDKSGSMNTTDPDRLAVDGARMFVDSLYGADMKERDGAGERSRVGLISFSLEAEELAAPVELRERADVESINERIDGIAYDLPDTGGTDLGKAVKAAAEMLQKSAGGTRKNMIVLFTDGYTDFLDDAERLAKESNEAMSQGIALAQELGCEIYVVGLNHNRRIDPAGRAQIWNIANATQTGEGLRPPEQGDINAAEKVNYLVTDSISEIRDFYQRLFAQIKDSVDPIEPGPPEFIGGWHYYDIDISTPGIYCVNIYMLSEEEIGGIKLWNANGDEQDLEGDSTYLSRGHGYAMLTIWLPDLGTWTLAIEGNGTYGYDVKYIPVTGIYLKMEPQGADGPSATVKVEAWYGDQKLDEEFYSHLSSAVCLLTSEGGGETNDFPLTYSAEENALLAAVTAPHPGRYTVKALVSTPQMEKQAVQTMEFSISRGPLQITLQQENTFNLNLDNEFHPEWGDISLTVNSVECTPENRVDISADGNTINLTGLEVGSADITIYAADASGQPWVIPVTVEITFNVMGILPVIAVSVLLAAALILVLYKRLCYIPGSFTVKLAYDDHSFAPIAVSSPRGASFSVYTLVSRVVEQLDLEGWEKKNLTRAVDAAAGELKAASIYIVRNKNSASGHKRSQYFTNPGRAPLTAKLYETGSGLEVRVSFRADRGR